VAGAASLLARAAPRHALPPGLGEVPVETRIILSSHDFERTPPRAELHARAAAMRDAGADVVKIAAMANDIVDAAAMLSLLQEKTGGRGAGAGVRGTAAARGGRPERRPTPAARLLVALALLSARTAHLEQPRAAHRRSDCNRQTQPAPALAPAPRLPFPPGPTIALSMGERGQITRLLAAKYGGHLTFAALSAERASAPGQPTIQQLNGLYRFGTQGPASKLFGIIGNPVHHSKSPLIHNSAFEHMGGYLRAGAAAAVAGARGKMAARAAVGASHSAGCGEPAQPGATGSPPSSRSPPAPRPRTQD
jgi:hypothetical protein